MTKRGFGVEVECGNYELNYTQLPGLLKKASVPFKSVGFDGSGIEVRTKILRGAEGFRNLKDLFLYLNEIDCHVAGCDGMHVHIDAPEFRTSRPRQLQLVKSWYGVQSCASTFVNARRGMAYGPSPLWSAHDLADFEHGRWPDRYYYRNRRGPYPGIRGALNLQCLSRTGSVEFRLHEGTLDYDKAEAWIKFCLAFVNHVAKLKQPMKSVATPEQLLRRVRAPKASASLVPA